MPATNINVKKFTADIDALLERYGLPTFAGVLLPNGVAGNQSSTFFFSFPGHDHFDLCLLGILDTWIDFLKEAHPNEVELRQKYQSMHDYLLKRSSFSHRISGSTTYQE